MKRNLKKKNYYCNSKMKSWKMIPLKMNCKMKKTKNN